MLGENGSPLTLKKAVVRLVKIDDFCLKDDDGFASDISVISLSSGSEDSPQRDEEKEKKRGRKRRYEFNDSGSTSSDHSGSRASTGSVSRSCSGSRGSSFSEDSTSSPRRRSKRPKLFIVPPESLVDHKNRSSRWEDTKNLDDNLNDSNCSNRNAVPSQRCRDCRQLKNDNPYLQLFPGDTAEAVRSEIDET